MIPSPPVPIDPPLGTIWRPEEAGPEDGPMTRDAKLSKLALGIIRVRKTCRRCKSDFDGWMFVAHYRRVETDLEEPFRVGLYRVCDDCASADQKRAEIQDLERRIQLGHERWEGARALSKKLPAAREIRRHLERLVALSRFGSDRFQKASDRLDAITAWIDEHRVTEAA